MEDLHEASNDNRRAVNDNKPECMQFFFTWSQPEQAMNEDTKLDQIEVTEDFNNAADPPGPPPSTPEPKLELNPPTPPGVVSPQLRGQADQTQQMREAFKQKMLLRQQFEDKARDRDR